MNCPCTIIVGSSEDGERLVIRSMVEIHNHEIIIEAFRHTKQQRKLPETVRQEAAIMLEMGAKPAKVRHHIIKQTGKVVTGSDVQNIRTKTRLEKKG